MTFWMSWQVKVIIAVTRTSGLLIFEDLWSESYFLVLSKQIQVKVLEKYHELNRGTWYINYCDIIGDMIFPQAVICG